MYSRTLKLSVIATLAALATGCGTARLVRSQPGKGGEVALVGMTDKAREEAQVTMARVCGNLTPEVVEEGEAVIGTRTTEDGSTSLDPWRRGTTTTRTSNTSESTQKTEWRIKFVCQGATSTTPKP